MYRNTFGIGHSLKEITEAHNTRHPNDPHKGSFGIKIPVLAAVKNKNSVTYVKFGEQFCIGDIQGACKFLEDNSFQVNLKSLVS